MSDNNYVAINATLRARTTSAVLIEPWDDGRLIWIPRTLINGVDERKLDNMDIDSATDCASLNGRRSGRA